MNKIRDHLVLWVAALVMSLGTPMLRARIRVVLLRGADPDGRIPQSLLDRAQLARRPGE